MKKLLFLLAITLSLNAFGQREVITVSTSGYELVDAINNAHDDLADSIANNHTNIAALLDSISDYIAGKPVAAGVKNAGAGQDGYVIGWDQTAGEYALQSASSGGSSDSSFVTVTADTLKLSTFGEVYHYSSNLQVNGANGIAFRIASTPILSLTSGNLSFIGTSRPLLDKTYNLGTSSYFWSGIYGDTLFAGTSGNKIYNNAGDMTFLDINSGTPYTLAQLASGSGDPVTLAGSYDYITLTDQVITRGQIDLTTDVTGSLPDANVANDITITNISQVQDITATATELNYTDGVTSNIQTQIDGISGISASAALTTFDSIAVSGANMIFSHAGAEYAVTNQDSVVDGGSVYKELIDTIPLFGGVIGVGNAGDTIGFTLNNVIWGQQWDGSHTAHITELSAVVAGTSPDVDIALLTDVNFRDATPTAMLSSDLTVTSTTSGNSTTSFSDATITKGDWVWIRIDEATTKPTQLVFTIYGYLE